MTFKSNTLYIHLKRHEINYYNNLDLSILRLFNTKTNDFEGPTTV